MQLYPTPENPLPDAAVCAELRTADGIRLRAMRARVQVPRGTVVVLGGRGDFMERYFETMRDLQARGFCVASVDFRGQGGSQRLLRNPYRGHTRSFAGFDEDVRTLMQGMVLPHCPPPYYAIGHSTGGHVLLRVLRKERWFSKAVLYSPLLDILYGPWPKPVAALLVRLANTFGFGWMFLPGQLHRPMQRQHFTGNPLTSDARRWGRDSGTLEAAPQLGLGGPTFSWLGAARSSFAAMRRLRPRHALAAPTLIVASGGDRVVSNAAMRAFARRIPGVALVVVPGARHELLTEADEYRAQALAAFDSFVGG